MRVLTLRKARFPSLFLAASLSLILSLTTGCSSNNTNNTETELSQRLTEELDAVLADAFEQTGAPGMVVSLQAPGIVDWDRSVGVSNKDTGEPISDDMHVRIGSVTKTLTTQLILMLQDKGLLKLDDTVNMYLSGIPNGDTITLRSLGNMTSGLANFGLDDGFQAKLFADPEQTWVPQEMVDIGIADTKAGCGEYPSACFPAGTSWFYSNTNTVILGQIIEHVTGQSYGDVLKEMVLDRLGLDNTVHPTTNALPAPFAHGYTVQGSPDDTPYDATFWNPTWGFAVGDIISTLDDLHIWAGALATGELLSDEAKAERFTTVGLPPLSANNNYAFGVGFLNGWWGHVGTIPGYNTLVYYRPDIAASLIILVNTDQESVVDGVKGVPVKVLGNKIMAILARARPIDTTSE